MSRLSDIAGSLWQWEARLHQAKKNEGGKVDVHRCAFVTAVGNIGQLSQIQPEGSLVNVGVTRQPRSCSRDFTLGATDQAPPYLPCSGVLRSQGMSGDVFVIKWDLSSGLPEFAKLHGATDAAATEDCGVLISMSIIAPFSIYQGNAHDTVGRSGLGEQTPLGAGSRRRVPANDSEHHHSIACTTEKKRSPSPSL